MHVDYTPIQKELRLELRDYFGQLMTPERRDGIKMLEITREKEVVWTYQNPDVSWVHSLQVLSTNGEPE